MKHAPQFIIAMQRALPMHLSPLLLLSLIATQAISQFDYNKVISPSPTASSLGKYGDVPVSLYTGTPNISIPLGALTGTELDIPISLSYMARGVKVEENASWVGTGWSLNAGGVITCTIRGHEDAIGKPRTPIPMPLSAADKSAVLLNLPTPCTVLPIHCSHDAFLENRSLSIVNRAVQKCTIPDTTQQVTENKI